MKSNSVVSMLASWFVLAGLTVSCATAADNDVGKPTTLVLETPKAIVLHGPDARGQVAVTAQFAEATARDWTRAVAYQVAPDGVVRVTTSGQVVPLGNGTATINAVGEGDLKVTVQVQVTDFAQPADVSFTRQVVPVLARLGCNSGVCHAKSGGQNGFQLSLYGFEPQKDFARIVTEARGRRLAPAAPESSLLLQKATSAVPHRGGQRTSVGSVHHQMLTRWIGQGAPNDSNQAPLLERLAIVPSQRTMTPGETQQLVVVAHYADGSQEPVNHLVQFEAMNKELAQVSEDGLVQLADRPGESVVMVRYQGQIQSFRATVPFGPPLRNEELPAPNNFIDEAVFAKLKQLGLPPSALCDDATFLRRVTLDIQGRLPTPEEAQAFFANKDPKKRDKLIDALTEKPTEFAETAFADYFALKWVALLRNQRKGEPGSACKGQASFSRRQRSITAGFYRWVHLSLINNKPYDQFVRELLTAEGELGGNPRVGWYRAVDEPQKQVEETAQVFLGIRLQCAQCHHHPFDKWGQSDYYGFAAIFSRLRTEGGSRKRNRLDGPLQLIGLDEGATLRHVSGVAESVDPSSGAKIPPTPLGDKAFSLTPDQDPRAALADWLTRPENPYFARSLVNRYWKHFLGRGIVEPEDDLRETNPPTNPELLAALAKHFVASGYDLRSLVRVICKSRVYQLSSAANERNRGDVRYFSHFLLRRLSAEVLLDAIDTVNDSTTEFTDMPKGTRAVQLEDYVQSGNTGGSFSRFLTLFGRPRAEIACECERSSGADLTQALHLLNAQTMHTKLAEGRAKKLVLDKRSDEEKLKDLYMRAFCRPPTPDELKRLLEFMQSSSKPLRENDKERLVREAWEDVISAIISTKEFQFNR